MPRKKNILITGVGGFIGSSLAHSLFNKYNIIGVDNFYRSVKSNLKGINKNFQLIEKNIMNLKIDDLPKSIDYVFHLAAISSLPECQNNPMFAYDINVKGTLNIIELSRNYNIQNFIFASTSAIYEQNKENIFREKNVTFPDLIYSQSKKNAEQLLESYSKNYSMPITVLRFFNTYGPRMDNKRISPPLISYIIKEILNNKNPILHSDGKQERDYIYIDDVIDVFKILLNTKFSKYEIYNICSEKTYSVNEIYKLIKDSMRTNIEPIFNKPKSFWDKFKNLYNGKYVFNQNRVKKEVNKFTLGSSKKVQTKLNWRAKTSIKSGINKTVNYYRNDFDF